MPINKDIHFNRHILVVINPKRGTSGSEQWDSSRQAAGEYHYRVS
ncbi:MAG: hypothetical protein ACI9LE_000997 [Paraglaciecola sp.]|jgi:hypothetical protein